MHIIGIIQICNNLQMVDVTNDILDHPCDELDTKMTTMYQATFKKRCQYLVKMFQNLELTILNQEEFNDSLNLKQEIGTFEKGIA